MSGEIMIKYWLYKRKPSGTYYLCWWDYSGHRRLKRRQSLRTKKKRIAQLKLRDYLRDEEAPLARRDIPLVSDLIPQYLEYIAMRKHKDTVCHHRTYLEEFAGLWGHLRVNQITVERIEEYIQTCGKNLKNTTKNKRISCLRKFFNMAVGRKYIKINPAKLVERLKDDTEVHDDVIEYDELLHLASFSSPKLRMFLFLLWHTGLRQGEAKRIKWSDIDFDNRLIRIQGEKAGENQLIKVRRVSINTELEAELVVFRQVPEGQHEFLFQHGGKPTWISSNRAFERVVKAAKKARLIPMSKHLTPHSCRHSTGTHLAQAGEPLQKIQQLLGHSSVTTTERFYAHYQPGYLKGATEALIGKNQRKKRSSL
ncbi:tyrosine-type recombinase/integrase [Acidobacteriota bacterium]